jgi:transcriptional pleiotropic regulator of transition state genes
MKATGFIRSIDALGRIVLPLELRNGFGMEPGTSVEIFANKKGIFLQHYATACTFCGTNEDLIQHHNKWICNKCKDEIAKK